MDFLSSTLRTAGRDWDDTIELRIGLPVDYLWATGVLTNGTELWRLEC